jgi:hypothetical protein
MPQRNTIHHVRSQFKIFKNIQASFYLYLLDKNKRKQQVKSSHPDGVLDQDSRLTFTRNSKLVFKHMEKIAKRLYIKAYFLYSQKQSP